MVVGVYEIDGLYLNAACAERRVQTLPNGDLRVAAKYMAHELSSDQAPMVGHQWVVCFAKSPAKNMYRTKFGVGRVARGGSGLHAEYAVMHDAATGALTLCRGEQETPIVWRLATLPNCSVTLQKANSV